jgi:hypothetical protein
MSFSFGGASTSEADDRLTRNELRSLILGKTVTWNAGGQATYGADGSYHYVGSNRSDRGTYTIGPGVTCVKFTTGFLRCDAWYKQGSGRYYIAPMSSKDFRSPARASRYDVISIR